MSNRIEGRVKEIGETGGVPAGASCKQIDISVEEGGSLYAEVTFLLVDY